MHYESCEAKSRRWRAEEKAYLERWPNHCTRCDGTGGFWSTFDPSPSGVSLGAGFFEDYDPCEACTGADPHPFCPRCHAVNDAWLEGEDPPCSACGWNWNKNQGDAIPPEPECACWMDERPDIL